MSDGTRSRDNSVSGAAAGGAEDIAARLRKAREDVSKDDPWGDWYDDLLHRINEHGELEHVLEAIETEIQLDRASYLLRMQYSILLKNVSDE